MMKMNKILGILLAVCFLLSVTAAAVSADPQKMTGPIKGPDKGPIKIVEKKAPPKFIKICHFVKGHYERKEIKIFVGFRHHKPVFKTKHIMVWVKGHVECKWVPMPMHRR
jgi:hypothetical protein